MQCYYRVEDADAGAIVVERRRPSEGNLLGRQRGSVGVITALAFPTLLGFGGLAVDASLWFRAKSSVQPAENDANYFIEIKQPKRQFEIARSKDQCIIPEAVPVFIVGIKQKYSQVRSFH